ncbi:tRNA (adenine(22)-N(1))-methyltransferase [Vibrio panuliri]|uniref:SAM-dependent methyltransferase n=1 Tax=Vibrio panuliri TaxID=1381081 RepID=A0ABX3F6H6_9VIBR|nr:tRNA (adenine(22)-N(1))-methyltransferase TrmK [Vibrio panuliri]KAB1457731.1 SAM-dependent methyltransferase [Vibrio panuliri]OLQ85787.1 SAM-dependent methyltransferase [Vibrio panuliri]
MKLSKRLERIEQLVSGNYDHVWDCCCDHGLLGATLLKREAAANIHFVDIVPTLMQQLEAKLKRFPTLTASKWHIHCQDVSTLPLGELSGTHLVIIAGVGGDLMTQFVENLITSNPTKKIDFLLCPVHHQFTLRQSLRRLKCGLIDECLIKENQRFYEIIYASTELQGNTLVAPVGDKLWQTKTTEQLVEVREYLEKTLAHYQRIQFGSKKTVEHIVRYYQAVEI